MEAGTQPGIRNRIELGIRTIRSYILLPWDRVDIGNGISVEAGNVE